MSTRVRITHGALVFLGVTLGCQLAGFPAATWAGKMFGAGYGEEQEGHLCQAAGLFAPTTEFPPAFAGIGIEARQ